MAPTGVPEPAGTLGMTTTTFNHTFAYAIRRVEGGARARLPGWHSEQWLAMGDGRPVIMVHGRETEFWPLQHELLSQAWEVVE